MFKKYLYKSFILKALLLLFIFSLIIGIITFVRSYTISNPNEIYGVNVEMSQLLPNSSSYVINNKGEDLIDLAAKLGVNMFRITNSTGNNVNKDATYSKAEWDVVLNKMRKKGIKALILVENPSIYQKNIPATYLPFMKSYIITSGVLSNPDIYGVDLYNEPLINNHNISLLKTAAHMIKTQSHQTKLTIGWWVTDTFTKDSNGNEQYSWNTYATGKQFESFVDFYSLHMYGFDSRDNILHILPDSYSFTRHFISTVKSALQTKKPILIEEFGAANGDSVSDQQTLGSKELQANTYLGVYQALKDEKNTQILGSIAYQLISRTNKPDAWAIVKQKGNYLFPAAYILQKYATGHSDVSLSLPFTSIPNDYLLNNSNDGQTQTVKINDIVGLNLTLDPTSHYAVMVKGKNILTQVELLTEGSDQNKYYAVFHILHQGKTKIIVTQNDNKAVFSVDLTVLN